MKIIEKMGKYLNEYDPIPRRGSGITAPEFKALQMFGFVEMHKRPTSKGKMPANPNYFTLTKLGRELVRIGLSQQVSVVEIIAEAEKTLRDAKEQLNILKLKMEQVEETMDQVSTTLSSIQGEEPRRDKIDMEEIVKKLYTAEKMADSTQRSGPLVSTEVYYKVLSDIMEDEEIDRTLYTLYEREKLDLQMGPHEPSDRGVHTLSGKVFYWGKLR